MNAQTGKPLFIPVVLGTPRQGRYSEHVAKFVAAEAAKIPGVLTELVDVRTLPMPVTGAGEDVKDPAFSELCMRADAFILVAPEYNHGYPGLLKHVLDTNLKEYIHKAVGICGVSAGGFGGTRVVQNMLPVMRELGLVTIFWDGNFSSVQKLFGPDGTLLDPSYPRRMEKFFRELVWMAKVLRYGRENVPLEG
ncbi:MAG TPA: NADPH-dependent FMN reductase [Thermoanaerobaculia bacterium]|nr:NADPH-dependent FMN reductase [Thermoanaerobaculia bacterium]